MQNIKSHLKAASRRLAHLRSRIEKNQNDSGSSYDKAEASALQSLIQIANVYNDARGQNGSHIENTLNTVRDVLSTTLHTQEHDLPSDEAIKLRSAWEKVNESLQLIRKIENEDVGEGS